jgi:hypothetical protein
MYVRCTHCGYDNSPEYRFCGMCGATLVHPTIPAKPPLRDVPPPPKPVPASPPPPEKSAAPAPPAPAPSFLGLEEDPKTEFHYLYEDEPPRNHTGLIAVLIIILGIGGAGYWQWRNHGFPFNRLGESTSAQQSAAPSEATSAQGEPTPAAGGAAPTQPDAGKTGESPAPVASVAPPNPSEAKQPSFAKPAPQRPVEQAKAVLPPSVAPSHSRKAIPPPKPEPKPAPVAPAVKGLPDADLEAAGERYLYGTGGVTANCAKAERSLRTAATHGNSKAQTVLGTMYATGHCVGRDLPAAYRWFARALHQDPQNSRIAEDLQVLWRQMSAEERQLATNSGQ